MKLLTLHLKYISFNFNYFYSSHDLRDQGALAIKTALCGRFKGIENNGYDLDELNLFLKYILIIIIKK